MASYGLQGFARASPQRRSNGLLFRCCLGHGAKMHSRGIRRLPVVSGNGLLEGLIAFDDVLEVTSEELSELVGLVAREQKLEHELRK